MKPLTQYSVLVITMLAVWAALLLLDHPLENEVAPFGIVSFELAGSHATAQQILSSWGPEERVCAGICLGLDYLFLVLYPAATGLACRHVAGGSSFGLSLARTQIVAGGLDAIENYCLIQILLGATWTGWPVVAKWCAIPKFLIVGVGLVHVLVSGLTMIRKKQRVD